MKFVVKVEYSENITVHIDDICNEETKIYQYNSKQLTAIRSKLFEIINNAECSSEDEEKAQNALRIVQDYLYIQRIVPLKMLESASLKILQNEDLIDLRNSLIRILNQHIIMYHGTMLPLYSRMIDVCASGLICIRDEMELRNMNPYLSKSEIREAQHGISNLGINYPVARF